LHFWRQRLLPFKGTVVNAVNKVAEQLSSHQHNLSDLQVNVYIHLQAWLAFLYFHEISGECRRLYPRSFSRGISLYLLQACPWHMEAHLARRESAVMECNIAWSGHETHECPLGSYCRKTVIAKRASMVYHNSPLFRNLIATLESCHHTDSQHSPPSKKRNRCRRQQLPPTIPCARFANAADSNVSLDTLGNSSRLRRGQHGEANLILQPNFPPQVEAGGSDFRKLQGALVVAKRSRETRKESRKPGKAFRYCEWCDHLNHVRRVSCSSCGNEKSLALAQADLRKRRRQISRKLHSIRIYPVGPAASPNQQIPRKLSCTRVYPVGPTTSPPSSSSKRHPGETECHGSLTSVAGPLCSSSRTDSINWMNASVYAEGVEEMSISEVQSGDSNVREQRPFPNEAVSDDTSLSFCANPCTTSSIVNDDYMTSIDASEPSFEDMLLCEMMMSDAEKDSIPRSPLPDIEFSFLDGLLPMDAC